MTTMSAVPALSLLAISSTFVGPVVAMDAMMTAA
jgi:hypothetical protein